MAGYSFLRKWIYRDGVEEININAYNDIEVILSGGRSMKIPEKFASPTQAIDVMRRMLTSFLRIMKLSEPIEYKGGNL